MVARVPIPPSNDYWYQPVYERFQNQVKNGTPTIVDIPENQWAIYKDTSTGIISLWTNDSGTLKQTVLHQPAPAFSLGKSVDQAVTSAIVTKVTFPNEDFDVGNCWDTTNNRFTPTVPGYYQINLNLLGQASGGTLTQMLGYIYKNGALFKVGPFFGNASPQTQVSSGISAVVYLNGTTDYVEFFGLVTGTAPSFLSSSNASGILVQSA